MGRAGLTAVFGMGTGVTPPVWSPEKWPAGVEAGPDTFGSGEVAHEATNRFHLMSGHAPRQKCQIALRDCTPIALLRDYPWFSTTKGSGSAPIGVVKLLGC